MKINPILFKKVQLAFQNNPQKNDQDILNIIIQQKQNRFNKFTIKQAIKKYKTLFNQIVQIQQPPKRKYPKITINQLAAIDQILKQLNRVFFYKIKFKEFYTKYKINSQRGLLLSGSTGVGKTSIARAYINQLSQYMQTIYIACSKYSFDNNNINQITKLINQKYQQKKKPIFLVLDDIDMLLGQKKQNRKNNSLIYLVDEFLEQENNMLLCTTKKSQSIDLNLKRSGRLGKQIIIHNPTLQSRKQILNKLGNYGYAAQYTPGFVAADLIGLIAQASIIACQKIQSTSSIKIQQDDIKIALKKIQPISKKQGFTNIPDVKWQDIGALQDKKTQIYNSIILPLKFPQKFLRLNIQISSGMLLFGPPGCGKTMLAKAVANQAKANFITIKGPELLSKYVGESQQAVRKVFNKARQTFPCIIFFDQFDALAPKRQDQGNQVSQRVVNTLLTQLCGFDKRKQVFVIAATNRPDILDPAILRSGRLQRHLYIPMPDQKDRKKILITQIKKVKHNEQIDYQRIVSDKRCEGFSGADIELLVKQAGIIAILKQKEQLQQEDLVQALDKVFPSISEFEQMKYKKVNKKFFRKNDDCI